LRFDGDKVHRARELLAYGYDKTAEEARVSKNSVIRAERGEEIRPSTARKIATALGVRVADLLKEDTADPLAEALASQDRLFDGASERDRFVERVKEYVEARVAHYQKRLTQADYVAEGLLLEDAIEEFVTLPDEFNGELAERWMLNPEVPENVKVDLGRAIGEVMQPLVEIVGRIGSRTPGGRTPAAPRLELVHDQDRVPQLRKTA
jgi:transcriptional regulator with XRE-family HTH domain